MTRPEAVSEAHKILLTESPERLIDAAGMLYGANVKKEGFVIDGSNAVDYLLHFVRKQLDFQNYELVAKLLWGENIFSTKPGSVQLIWNKLPLSSEVLVMGAGALGKSFSVAVWLLLDWLRDPEHTCIKVLSVTEEHAKRNVFAHIKNLFDTSLIPLPGTKKEKSIQVNDDDKQGIHLMTIPAGDEGKGRLRGFHPVPRAIAHPQFGSLTRIRVILDEAEEIPQGVWEDVDNILITLDGVEHVKIIGASNPKDRVSKFGQRCEPKDGWMSVSIEDSEQWKGRLGWDVIRLDGARCENVTQQKMVFPGLLTWDGYQRYLKLGDTSPEYFTMCRGWFPEKGLHINVIPQDFIETSRGHYTFTGAATYALSVDLAFEGGDRAVATIGRWGKASEWTSYRGVTKKFDQPRFALQVESQFELNKTHTLDMVDQIMKTCKSLYIKPLWVIVDRTGNGTGVHDALCVKFGPDVMGLNFGEKATEKRVLEDDSEKAEDLYDGVVTELFFATRKFMEFDYLKFGQGLRLDHLSNELTSRRYKQGSLKRVRVESKKEYKSRGNPSPDYADSLTMLVHLVRQRGDFTVSMLATESGNSVRSRETGLVDTLEFMDFST